MTSPPTARLDALHSRPCNYTSKTWLKTLLTVRAIDHQEAHLIRQGRGWIHIPSAGHEAIGTLAESLHADDLLFLYYRDRALMHARGVSTKQLAREFLATASSCSAGRAMPIHGTYKKLGIFPPATPTSSQCLPAVGAAWGMKLRGLPNIVLCTIGDASTRQGEFYEAIAQAIQLRLPIVFVVEDNGFGISTRTDSQLPFRLGIFDTSTYLRIDGRDIDAVASAGAEAIAATRQGHGPRILWVELDRLTSHTNSDDQRVYRTAKEIDAMSRRDPLLLYENRLKATHQITERDLDCLKSDIETEVRAIYEAAETEAAPSDCSMVNRDSTSSVAPPPASTPDGGTMVSALNGALAQALAGNPDCIVFGEDVEDPKGGVFGFTKGLSSRFPGRVVNSPLAEATIVGMGVGLAATNFKPILEMQFIDFLAPGFNQLITQLATLRWRSNDDWKCPAVIYAPYGAYLPAGSTWHSQSNEGIWAHIPGIAVAVPSNPQDLSGLFFAALVSDDPVMLLIPKHLMRVRHSAAAIEILKFGQARICREGTDVTVVSWGNCVELACTVAEQRSHRLSVEVIDLVSLVPCDWATIERSVRKTGRLVVICEDNRMGSFGQSVIAEMVSSQERFDLLLSPPTLVARSDCHIPFHPALEMALLPDEQRVHDALTQVMR